ncbi:MAG: peptidase M16, partial [Planctomyces sp.]|nr:peptidase M16 [Planctomyces sp.]
GAELDRVKARAKSSLVMQQESSYSRSSSIARDWHHLGRVTTLDEILDQINALTVPRVEAFIKAHPAEDFTILTIGPRMLEKRI